MRPDTRIPQGPIRRTDTRYDGATTEGYSPIPFAERHVLDYVRVLYKRRWTAIPAVVAVLLYVAYKTFTATPLYEARAQLLIEAEAQNVISFKEVVEQDRATTDYYQTQYRILQSRGLAKATIDALQLWEHPEFGGRSAATTEPTKPTGIRRLLQPLKTARSWVEVRLGTLFDSSPTPAAAPSDSTPVAAELQRKVDETAAQSGVIHAFLSRLTIAPVRNSRLVDVKFQATNPTLAASVANALSEQYIQQNLQFKFQASKEATEWLSNQLREQRKAVEDSEINLQKYREKHDAVATENSSNIVLQKLTNLNTAVTNAKTDRIQKEALYRQLQAAKDDPEALKAFPAILSNLYVQRLKTEVSDLERRRTELATELGEQHPDMINLVGTIALTRAKLRTEVDNVVQSVEREYRTAVAQEQSLVAALDAQKMEALSLNRKEIGSRVLERDKATNQQIFDTLLQRARETGISGELKTNNIRIADRADVPRSPMWPRTRRNMVLALFIGSLLGIVFAFAFEYLDNKIKSPDEIKMLLGLPCLGMVPKIPSREMPESAPLLNNGVPPSFSEAFRSVRTNVLFSANGSQSRTLVITSTGPGEGKTLVSTNLATGMAMTGQRVLLVDADLRRPRVHEVFKQVREPGTSDVLSGRLALADGLRKTDVPNLWIMPAGRALPNPAELLSSPAFVDFLRYSSQHFDWVIIDSPPVMPVTDAAVIAHVASSVLFVVGSEVVTLPAAMRALERLDVTNAKFMGALLNGVDLKRNAFFYSPYYRREYSDSYGPSASA